MKKFYFILSITTMVLMVVALVGILNSSTNQGTLNSVYLFNISSVIAMVSVYRYEKLVRKTQENLVD